MKKKGFTLVEIIAVIGILSVIGTASFFGIRLVSKNIRISKLNQITDEAVNAAQVYLETNKEAYNQLYKKQNGVVVPLNVLVDEGFLSLKNTDLKSDDLEGEYIITALSSSTENTDDCVDIRTETSWYKGSSAPIYICTNSSGNSNLAIINPESISNLNKVSREAYYYRGYNAHNYAKFKKDTNYLDLRIMSVDTDDSLTVYKHVGNSSSPCSYKWNDDFSQDMSFTKIEEKTITYIDILPEFKVSTAYNNYASYTRFFIYHNSSRSCGGNPLSVRNYMSTFGDSEQFQGVYVDGQSSYWSYDSWLPINQQHDHYRDEYLHLKPCIKITSGTGAEDNPYILEKQGTC